MAMMRGSPIGDIHEAVDDACVATTDDLVAAEVATIGHLRPGVVLHRVVQRVGRTDTDVARASAYDAARHAFGRGG
jgi:hypothetical protein